MQGKVEISGVNTAKLTVLKSDEMTQLLQRCKQGDEAARQKLIEGNLRLVLSVIQRFSHKKSLQFYVNYGIIQLVR